jgi:hypothetical protein
MVKLTNLIIVLASGLAVTAFSLEKPNAARFHSSSALRPLKKSTSYPERPMQFSSVILSSEGTESSGEVVASAATTAAPKKGLIDILWNDNTKLAVYLAVWYLGNIYCKSYQIIIAQMLCCDFFDRGTVR